MIKALLAKIGLYGEQHPQRDVIGMGVFLRASQAPANPSWLGGADSPVRGIGLDEFLPDWLARHWFSSVQFYKILNFI